MRWKCDRSVCAFDARLLLAAAVALFAACTPFKNARPSPAKEADAGELTDAEASRARDIDAASAETDVAGHGGVGAAGAGGAAGTPSRAEPTAGAAAGTDAPSTAGQGGSSGNRGAAGEGVAGAPEEEPPLSMEPLDPTARAVAAETADAEALERLSDWSRLPVLGTGRYEQQSSRDRSPNTGPASGVYSGDAYGNRDYNHFVCKSDDTDLDPTLTGYRFDQPACAESYVRGAVMARFEGSGQMNRLWMAWDALQLGTSGPEVMRVYVDDNPAVVIQVPLSLVSNGMAGESFTIPFGATSSISVAWHYPIVFSRKLVVALDHLNAYYYYQVDAVLDAQPRRRVAARRRLDQRDTAHALLVRESPVPAYAVPLRSEQLDLAPSGERSVQLSGPATIQELRVRVPAARIADLASVRVSARWDGLPQAAIDLPLSDLFGSSREVPSSKSLALAASREDDVQTLSLRLPMPFRQLADWKLINTGEAPISFQLDWIGEPSVPNEAFGTLHVQLNDAASPPAQLEQTVAEAAGRGRFVGLCADLGGRADPQLIAASTDLDLLQGDFRMTADDRFAIQSTGTEDYADSAYYFLDSPKSAPFAQNWGKVDDSSANPPGQVSFCRWQVLGSEIDFQRSFRAIHEVSQHNLSIVQKHRTVAFLYLE